MNLSAEGLWQGTLHVLSDILSEVNALQYFGGTSGISIDGDVLKVSLPDNKDGNTLLNMFGSIIYNALKQAGAPDNMRVEFVVSQTLEEEEEFKLPSDMSLPPDQNGLLPGFTFDTFVEGPSNQFPVAMAKYVAQHPGDEASRTNPLFMYGPTGVGKTHLLHAIGQLALQKNANLKVLYTTSDNLVREYVSQWVSGDQAKEAFRKKYRTPDILLVDDIQMLKTPGVQNEFFNIFNALKDAGHQIVMTSDQPPNEIPELMDRLVSRFMSGICADVDIPAYETRYNILMLKMRSYTDVTLSPQVIDFIAQNVTSSVRALEGALSKTVNYARMFPGQAHHIVTPDVLEKSVLKEYIQQEESMVHLTREDIQRAVCEHFHIRMEDLLGKSRAQEIAQPRQIAIFLCRKLTASTMAEIGKAFNRNHTTVHYSCTTVQNLYNTGDTETTSALKTILASLGRTLS